MSLYSASLVTPLPAFVVGISNCSCSYHVLQFVPFLQDLGPNHPIVAISLQTLGHILRMRQQLSEALEAAKRCEQLRASQAHGPPMAAALHLQVSLACHSSWQALHCCNVGYCLVSKAGVPVSWSLEDGERSYLHIEQGEASIDLQRLLCCHEDETVYTL